MIATNRKDQRYSDIEYDIQKLTELEAKMFEELERRYTEDDLVFAWGKGYEARVHEESEGFWTG